MAPRGPASVALLPLFEADCVSQHPCPAGHARHDVPCGHCPPGQVREAGPGVWWGAGHLAALGVAHTRIPDPQKGRRFT